MSSAFRAPNHPSTASWAIPPHLVSFHLLNSWLGTVLFLLFVLVTQIASNSNVAGFNMIASQKLFSDSNNDIISLEFYFSGPDGQLFCGGREKQSFFQGKTVFSGSGASVTAAMTITDEFQLVALAVDRQATVVVAVPFTVSVLVAHNNIGGTDQSCAMLKYDTSTSMGLGVVTDLLYPKDPGSITSLTVSNTFPAFITGPRLKSWKLTDLSPIRTSSYTHADKVSPIALSTGSKLFGYDFQAKRVLQFDANSLDAVDIISALSDLAITSMKAAYLGDAILACTISSCYCIQASSGVVWTQKSNKLAMAEGGIYSNYGQGMLASIGLENSASAPGTKFATLGTYVISPTFQNLFQTTSIVVQNNVPNGTPIGVIHSPNTKVVFAYVGQRISVYSMLEPPSNCNISSNVNGDQQTQVCLVCSPNYSMIAAPGQNATCQNITCSSECATCFGPSSDDCLSCYTPKILKSTSCRYPCPPGCVSCKGLAPNDCEICQDGLHLYQGNCFKCPSNCFECSSNTTCIKCNTSITTLSPATKTCIPCWDPKDYKANQEVCRNGLNSRFLPWTAKPNGTPELGKDSVKQVTVDFKLEDDMNGQLTLSTLLLDKGMLLNTTKSLALRYHRTNQILLVVNNSMLPNDVMEISVLNKLEFNYITALYDPTEKQMIEYRLAQNQQDMEYKVPANSLTNDPFWSSLNSNLLQGSQGLLMGFSVFAITKSCCRTNMGGSFIQLFQIVELFGKLFYTPVVFSAYTELMLTMFHGMGNMLSIPEDSILSQRTKQSTRYLYKITRAADEKDILRSNPLYVLTFLVS